MERHLRKTDGHGRPAFLSVHNPRQRVLAVHRLAVQEGRRRIQTARQGEEVHRARFHLQSGGHSCRKERDHQARHRQEEAIRKRFELLLLLSLYRSDVVCVLCGQGPLVRWLKVNFSECFCAWIHVKALRVFVESVLRFGDRSVTTAPRFGIGLIVLVSDTVCRLISKRSCCTRTKSR